MNRSAEFERLDVYRDDYLPLWSELSEYKYSDLRGVYGNPYGTIHQLMEQLEIVGVEDTRQAISTRRRGLQVLDDTTRTECEMNQFLKHLRRPDRKCESRYGNAEYMTSLRARGIARYEDVDEEKSESDSSSEKFDTIVLTAEEQELETLFNNRDASHRARLYNRTSSDVLQRKINKEQEKILPNVMEALVHHIDKKIMQISPKYPEIIQNLIYESIKTRATYNINRDPGQKQYRGSDGKMREVPEFYADADMQYKKINIEIHRSLRLNELNAAKFLREHNDPSNGPRKKFIREYYHGGIRHWEYYNRARQNPADAYLVKESEVDSIRFGLQNQLENLKKTHGHNIPDEVTTCKLSSKQVNSVVKKLLYNDGIVPITRTECWTVAELLEIKQKLFDSRNNKINAEPWNTNANWFPGICNGQIVMVKTRLTYTVKHGWKCSAVSSEDVDACINREHIRRHLSESACIFNDWDLFKINRKILINNPRDGPGITSLKSSSIIPGKGLYCNEFVILGHVEGIDTYIAAYVLGLVRIIPGITTIDTRGRPTPFENIPGMIRAPLLNVRMIGGDLFLGNHMHIRSPLFGQSLIGHGYDRKVVGNEVCEVFKHGPDASSKCVAALGTIDTVLCGRKLQGPPSVWRRTEDKVISRNTISKRLRRSLSIATSRDYNIINRSQSGDLIDIQYEPRSNIGGVETDIHRIYDSEPSRIIRCNYNINSRHKINAAIRRNRYSTNKRGRSIPRSWRQIPEFPKVRQRYHKWHNMGLAIKPYLIGLDRKDSANAELYINYIVSTRVVWTLPQLYKDLRGGIVQYLNNGKRYISEKLIGVHQRIDRRSDSTEVKAYEFRNGPMQILYSHEMVIAVWNELRKVKRVHYAEQKLSEEIDKWTKSAAVQEVHESNEEAGIEGIIEDCLRFMSRGTENSANIFIIFSFEYLCNVPCIVIVFT